MPERINPSDAALWPEYGWEHLQRYAFALRCQPEGPVLDLGCGIGYGSEILSRSGTIDVAGVDVDRSIVAAANKRGYSASVQFYTSLADAAAAHPGGFAFATMFEVIEHVPAPTETLREVAERLKPGALLVISAPNRLRFTGAPVPIENPAHLHEPTYADLRSWLEARFVVIGEFEQSDLRLGAFEHLVLDLQRSWVLRLERRIRRAFGFRSARDVSSQEMIRKTDIFPLIAERRASCRQFVFVAQKR